MTDFENIGDLAKQLARSAKPTSPARDRLRAAFAVAAGEAMASQVQVRGRRGTRLLLETESPALLSELRGFRAAPILAAWPADPPSVPEITELSIRLAGRPGGSHPRNGSGA